MVDKTATVLITSFYEWINDGGKKKQQRIFIDKMDVFYLPALYHKKNDEIYVSFITVPSNKFMEQLHSRMPVIFRQEASFKLSNR